MTTLKATLALALLGSITAACEPSMEPLTQDSPMGADAGPVDTDNPDSAIPLANCGLAANIGDLGKPGAFSDRIATAGIVVDIPYGAEAGNGENIAILFWDDGAFPTVASFDLATQGDSLNCVACATLVVPIDATSDHYLYAESGTLSFTEVNEQANGHIVGTLKNAVLREVNNDTGELIAGGCATTIDSVEFDATFGQQAP